jgi:hypothetical protein
MSLEITGKLEKFLDVESGTSKAGKEWKKQSFIVRTEEEYNNLYCFEVFGDEKVDNLTKYQKEGDLVKVVFNVGCNEWKGKYFTSLSAWRIEKTEGAVNGVPTVDQPTTNNDASPSDDMPF